MSGADTANVEARDRPATAASGGGGGGGGEPGADARPDRPHRARGGRKLAEWVTLAASAALVLVVAGFLGYEALREDGPYVAADVRPLPDRAQQRDGQFILPVEVRNRGDRTLRDFRGEVVYRAPDGSSDRREINIDYLGERATVTVYVYSRADPAGLRVEARSLNYRLE